MRPYCVLTDRNGVCLQSPYCNSLQPRLALRPRSADIKELPQRPDVF